MITGTVMDLKRFAVHDGDGIRTTVFLKGCSLKCVWCHNPEGIGFQPQIAYYANKCINCGMCMICPEGVHTMSEKSGHMFQRELCTGCGKCADVCLGNALVFYGKSMTVEELLPLLLEDRKFYENSGGGVTISGGECLCQSEFCAALLKALKDEGINTAIDTCGEAARTAIDAVALYTDVFLYDIKAVDEDVHILCTGKSNRRILENLRYIDGLGKSIEVRIPYVTGYNDGQMEKIKTLLLSLKNLTKIRVLPYHNYAGSKYASLGMENTLPKILPSRDACAQAEDLFRNAGLTVV